MFHVKPDTSTERQEFYQRLSGKNTAPLWEYLARLVTPEPQTGCVPAHWKYEDVRPLLMEAGELISAKEAERRVLVLENPGLPGESKITSSLYAGIQLVMPGEIAATHRHTASALRFVLESDGGFTSVDGEQTTMRPGDFILTPNWTYHDHGNPGTKPTVWLDGLDLHIVNLLGASFASHHPQETQPVTRPDDDSATRYGANLLPVEYKSSSQTAPLFCYPCDRSREALETLRRNGPRDPMHGAKMQYINPVTGGYPLPTIAAFLQLLPKGFRGSAYRSTDAAIYCAVEGQGRSHIGTQSFDWKKHDVFVAPSWFPVSHQSDEDAVLFSFSDRAVQKALGLWREEADRAGL